MQPLKGKVAGATRGACRGIARKLGAAGATVYCTGRSVRGKPATKSPVGPWRRGTWRRSTDSRTPTAVSPTGRTTTSRRMARRKGENGCSWERGHPCPHGSSA